MTVGVVGRVHLLRYADLRRRSVVPLFLRLRAHFNPAKCITSGADHGWLSPNGAYGVSSLRRRSGASGNDANGEWAAGPITD